MELKQFEQSASDPAFPALTHQQCGRYLATALRVACVGIFVFLCIHAPA